MNGKYLSCCPREGCGLHPANLVCKMMYKVEGCCPREGCGLHPDGAAKYDALVNELLSPRGVRVASAKLYNPYEHFLLEVHNPCPYYNTVFPFFARLFVKSAQEESRNFDGHPR